MDADKVLLAIEEKRKWEERAAEVERQLGDLRARRKALQDEFRAVSERVRYYSALAESFREYSVARASGVYFQEGPRHL